MRARMKSEIGGKLKIHIGPVATGSRFYIKSATCELCGLIRLLKPGEKIFKCLRCSHTNNLNNRKRNGKEK